MSNGDFLSSRLTSYQTAASGEGTPTAAPEPLGPWESPYLRSTSVTSSQVPRSSPACVNMPAPHTSMASAVLLLSSSQCKCSYHQTVHLQLTSGRWRMSLKTERLLVRLMHGRA